MKKLLSASIFIIFSFLAKSQTTREEYNYVTKGYKVQIESGLDMKKGYEFKEVMEEINVKGGDGKSRDIELKALYRLKGATKTLAAYLLIYRLGNNAPEYYCIPNPNSDKDILGYYYQALYNGYGDSSERLRLFAFILGMHLKW